ncbi:peptide-methionine (S)-S-oxide reductase MsrA (plasmid) [Kovacikia minuta CCNUW1]|uniref:peptide-methionine (S)-S-oxide reductase MsrA n=1 Tax=Kovacikia minuta TaxID=2931930 RepID=UPI001CCDC9A4|nr:peptide-methionine (S)-S-oxide reductase MsrA [Kovacikia minuta]UBF30213.1 peptide-methionine (S)-S-oxide reductase MsrA [Kovacikia minuta CCNUW1]
MSSFRLSLILRLMRKVSLVSLTAIALVGSISYIVFSNPASKPSASLQARTFPNPQTDIPASAVKGEQTLVLAGGCFWGMEAVFEHLKGVSSVVSGFSGGNAKTADYETVSAGQTGHAESVKITYDPSQISYGQLLKVFFSVAHDPTELNRQGPDSGTQYRSAIFFSNQAQKQVAQAYIKQLNQAHIFPKPIVTQLASLNGFYAAEDYHQDFIAHHPNYPYVVINDLPKLNQLKQQFTALYRN